MQVAACAAGTHRNKVTQLCDTCEAGKFTHTENQDACVECNANEYGLQTGNTVQSTSTAITTLLTQG